MVSTASIGEEVKLHLEDGNIFSGIVFSIDRKLDCLVLEEPHPQSTLKRDVRIVKLSLIKNIESINPAPSKVDDLPAITVEQAEQREKEAIAKAKAELAKIGQNVTPEAQALFDALCKTYELR